MYYGNPILLKTNLLVGSTFVYLYCVLCDTVTCSKMVKMNECVLKTTDTSDDNAICCKLHILTKAKQKQPYIL